MEAVVCQSCGMPMVAQEHFGTNRDQSPNPEYCTYCYQNGAFCDDHTLDETVADHMQYPDPVPTEKGYVLSDEEKALHIRLHLITLKRWNVKYHTQESYFRAVHQAIEYIRRHLCEPLDLQTIAREAAISRFHFHRIFKAIMNESPGDFIQRIRLENAAFKLQTTRLPLSEIAFQTGYQTQQSLSRSFKKQYGVTPSVYRRKPTDLSLPVPPEACNVKIDPDIRQMVPVEVICIWAGNPFRRNNAFTSAWDKLLSVTGANGIPDDTTSYYCINRDVPTITQPDKQQIYVCIHSKKKLNYTGTPGKQTIPGGLYAVFPVKGSHKMLSEVYCYIYRHWLPNSEFEVRDSSKFEKFLTNPAHVKEEENLTEIYIPVSKK